MSVCSDTDNKATQVEHVTLLLLEQSATVQYYMNLFIYFFGMCATDLVVMDLPAGTALTLTRGS